MRGTQWSSLPTPICAGHETFVAVGGDGTSYEIVNGALPLALEDGERIRLGFLPLGTGNSFLRDFTTEDGASFAKAAIREGRTRVCDVVRFKYEGGEAYSMNILSLGFVADVGGTTNRRFKRFGEAGYVFGVVTEVARLAPQPIPFSVDGGEMDRSPVTFLSFNNSRFTGGKMMMAPHADTSDGELDVIRVGSMGRMSLLGTFPKIFSGTHMSHPATSERRARHVVFDVSNAVDVLIDGEVMRVRPESLDVLPGVLEVRV